MVLDTSILAASKYQRKIRRSMTLLALFTVTRRLANKMETKLNLRRGGDYGSYTLPLSVFSFKIRFQPMFVRVYRVNVYNANVSPISDISEPLSAFKNSFRGLRNIRSRNHYYLGGVERLIALIIRLFRVRKCVAVLKSTKLSVRTRELPLVVTAMLVVAFDSNKISFRTKRLIHPNSIFEGGEMGFYVANFDPDD